MLQHWKLHHSNSKLPPFLFWKEHSPGFWEENTRRGKDWDEFLKGKGGKVFRLFCSTTVSTLFQFTYSSFSFAP